MSARTSILIVTVLTIVGGFAGVIGNHAAQPTIKLQEAATQSGSSPADSPVVAPQTMAPSTDTSTPVTESGTDNATPGVNVAPSTSSPQTDSTQDTSPSDTDEPPIVPAAPTVVSSLYKCPPGGEQYRIDTYSDGTTQRVDLGKPDVCVDQLGD